MSRQVEFRQWVEAARAASIGDVVDARRIPLRRVGRVERVGPCPSCGGHDRFGINTNKNVFRCRQCEAKGDPIAFVEWLDGCDFLTACASLTGMPSPLGHAGEVDLAALAALEAKRREQREAEKTAADRFRRRELRRLRRMWVNAAQAPGSPVEAYLRLRGLSLPPHACLRYVEAMPYYASGSPDAAQIHLGPAMVAAIASPEGLFTGLHITWLDLAQEDGKAVIPDPETGEVLTAKKMRGSVGDGHIELTRQPEPRVLIIGEGIESVLSVREALIHVGEPLEDVAFWSGLNLGNIGGPALETVKHPSLKHRNGHAVRVPGLDPTAAGGIAIPDSVVDLRLLGDGDSDPFTTRTALERGRRRYARPGRHVALPFAPDGTDFNSYLRGS